YTGPETLDFKDVPEPTPAGSDESVVRIEAVGICGSDMHAFHGHDPRRPAPLILGHEAAGTVVGGPREGERVTINPLVSCGMCDACLRGRQNLCPKRQILSMPPREGAFAQFVAAPDRNLIPIPDTLSAKAAACAEPFACGWHAVRLAGSALDRPLNAANAVVLGGGGIGVGAALCLKIAGCAAITIVEPHAGRRGLLEDAVGLSAVTAAEHVDDDIDLVIDAVGYEATRQTASSMVKPGGVILHIGLGGGDPGLDIRRMTLQEITFIGTYTYTMADFQETVSALARGRFEAMDWLDVRDLSDGAAAFADLSAGQVTAPKIVLEP
ncbi:MAG: alcohol dehydrogenase catalytic domain-containing protein, partial [Pseudomonadota bacterium]